MGYKEILDDLKKRIFKPIYFLMGAEPFYIDLITNYIAANVLTESEKSFNQTVLYGKDTDIATVINAAKRYPMMASHQVVIVKEAQELKDIDSLIYYAEKPLNSTILVLNYKYKTLDKRKKLFKQLQDKHILYESPQIRDYQVPSWITMYLKEKKVTIAANAAAVLTENLGTDLGKIANELDKLIITLPKGTDKITVEQIEKNIGLSKDFNTFELQKALTERNTGKAFKIVHYFNKNPKNHHITLTISSLYYYFSKVLAYHFVRDKSNKREVAAVLKVNPFFVDEYRKAAQNYNAGKVAGIISLLRNYDVRSKGVGNGSTSDSDLLRELIYQIMH